jgi:hypothetical protein
MQPLEDDDSPGSSPYRMCQIEFAFDLALNIKRCEKCWPKGSASARVTS